VVCNLAQLGNFGNILTSLTLTELNVKRLGFIQIGANKDLI